jgi:uncharacterized repeat protein (TIGR03803 family)
MSMLTLHGDFIRRKIAHPTSGSFLKICVACLIVTSIGWAQTLNTLHIFEGTDGGTPYAGLIMDANGDLLGTTPGYGLYGGGNVFELAKVSTGWRFGIAHSFSIGKDGNTPYYGSLVADTSGNFYGTTNNGGDFSCDAGGCGTVFELTQTQSGAWQERVIHRFRGGLDGSHPSAGLLIDKSGNLYGTTLSGGSNACVKVGCGTVFELTPSNGAWTETIIHAFNRVGSDGANPNGGLAFDTAGNIYGTTTYANGRSGTVFELSPTSSGWIESVLLSFVDTDGAFPYGTLVVDKAGNLFGTTLNGGERDWGTVFEMTPSAAGCDRTDLLYQVMG